MKKRILVTYFSASGETREKAKVLSSILGADIHEITPKEKYSDEDLNWRDKHSRSTVEMDDENCRPEIVADDLKLENFDIVFIGYPIWWYVEPRIIETFIESHDFTNKIIVPFATSGGSGIDKSVKHLRSLYPNLRIESGLLLNYRVSKDDILKKVEELD